MLDVKAFKIQKNKKRYKKDKLWRRKKIVDYGIK